MNGIYLYFVNKHLSTWALLGLQDTDSIENIVKKGEIAHLEQFRLFPQCFPKAFFFNVLNEYIRRKGVRILGQKAVFAK